MKPIVVNSKVNYNFICTIALMKVALNYKEKLMIYSRILTFNFLFSFYFVPFES